ncbi:MAG: hypothetical protein LBB20_01910 [Puniceicoccales bacterium]|jgi:hypothetical protein|nr:hypothetical protein [Puniceicoccales bacterium]
MNNGFIKKLSIFLLLLIGLGYNGYADPNDQKTYVNEWGVILEKAPSKFNRYNTHINSPLVENFGRAIYDVPPYGDCGYWAIAVGRSPRKGYYAWEDMLEIRKIIWPNIPDYKTADYDYWLDNGMVGYGDESAQLAPCARIAMAINRPIVTSVIGDDMLCVFDTDGMAYRCRIVDSDRQNKKIVTCYCFKCVQTSQGINHEWNGVQYSADTSFGLLETRYPLGNIIYGATGIRCDMDEFNDARSSFLDEYFENWTNIYDIPAMPKVRKGINANRIRFEKAWNEFFGKWVDANIKLWSIINEGHPIFICLDMANSHWGVALREVSRNGYTGALCTDRSLVRSENTFEYLRSTGRKDPNYQQH